MQDQYDGIILGAGHNSLILQAYLGQAGFKVLCLERSAQAGGGLATMEDSRHPGFLHNTHSFYHRGLTHMPWYHDLQLERHGAHYLEPELNVALVLKDGTALEWWTDFDRTVASFARFSSHDARTLIQWRERFLPVLEHILTPEAQAPPLPVAKRRALLRQSPEGRLLLKTSRLSPLEFVQSQFQHPAVQAGLLFFNGLREVDLRAPGFGHHIPALLASPGKAQMCRGGSAALARALVQAVQKSGGHIQLQTTPQQLCVENGRVTGVKTTDGTLIQARHFVASELNPQQTFLELLDADVLPHAWRAKAQAYRYNLLAPLFGLYANLRQPPQYTAAQELPHLNQAFMVILGLNDSAQFKDIIQAHEQGTLPPPVMWGSCPTQFDPTQAPLGQHTAFMWEKTPYALYGNASRWDRSKERHGRRLLAQWQRYAPNLETAVIDWYTRSPLDTERSLPNMRGGDLLVGELNKGQTGYHRPFAGAGHYRGHLQGLYLCGSSCHPGGNITGLPGYNCAQILLHDLGCPAPWAPPPLEHHLAHL